MHYKADMKSLNILDNTLEPKATQNLEVMKDMISNLISKDVAYKTSDSVYFDTSKDSSMALYQIISVMKIHIELKLIKKKEIQQILLYGNLQKKMM